MSWAESIVAVARRAITGTSRADRIIGKPPAGPATRREVVEVVDATGEDPEESVSQLPSDDELVSSVAARLVSAGNEALARSLLSSADLALRYGASWWDGHDDYIYDVHVIITADPAVEAELRAGEVGLRRAIGGVVDFHRNSLGDWTRGTLETVAIEVGPIQLDGQRRQRRERLTQQHLS